MRTYREFVLRNGMSLKYLLNLNLIIRDEINNLKRFIIKINLLSLYDSKTLIQFDY